MEQLTFILLQLIHVSTINLLNNSRPCSVIKPIEKYDVNLVVTVTTHNIILFKLKYFSYNRIVF